MSKLESMSKAEVGEWLKEKGYSEVVIETLSGK